MNYHLTAKYKIERVGVSKKNKTADVFSRLGNETSVYQRSPPWLGDKKIFFGKKKSWERTISEHDNTQHKHKSTLRNVFFFIINLLGID